MPNDNKKKQLGIYLPIFLIKKLKIYAAKHSTNLSNLIEKVMTEFLNRKENH